MKKFKAILAILFCISLVLSFSVLASAKELVYPGTLDWSFIPAPDPEGVDQPTIELQGTDYIATYFGMQRALLICEYDFSRGNPTGLKFEYAIGATQVDMDASGFPPDMYMVIGEDPMDGGRWWSGPYAVHSTGAWDEYEVFEAAWVPGGELAWPTGVQKIWLFNSSVGGINIKSFTIVNSEVDSEPNPTTGESDSAFVFLTVALIAAAAIIVSKKRAVRA